MVKPQSGAQPRPRRVLLKLSGESLQDRVVGRCISPVVLEEIVGQIARAHSEGVEIALVVGGGNIFRGLSESASGMNRTTADYMGMLATVFNSIALQDALSRAGRAVSLYSALNIEKLAEPVSDRKPVAALERGSVVIFAAGTGNPFFTTDTAAALRAVEIGADILLKATRVDGVYDRDPEEDSDAVLFTEISYLDVIQKGLRLMDLTAVSLCRENALPIGVFNLGGDEAVYRALTGEKVGTIIIEQGGSCGYGNYQ